MHLRQHMEIGPLIFTFILYQLIFFLLKYTSKYVGGLTVTNMGWFDDYSDDAPRSKTMRGNCITTFLFHVAQCIIFNQTYFFTATLISKAWLKSLYSRLGFKVIKIFAASPNFEKSRKQFHYRSLKSKTLKKQTIGLQFYLIIPQCVTIISYNKIGFTENKDVFK